MNVKNVYESPAYVSYFYGRLLRDEAEKILRNRGCKNGLFLLRELVQEAGSYAMSICYKGEIHHYKIVRQEDGLVKIDKGRKFIGPIELIKHHQQEQDGLVTKPTISCERPKGTLPIYYLFVNDSEFNKLVDDEIKSHLSKYKNQLSHQQYSQELVDARGRYRYKYEKSVLVELHHSQPWFKSNLDRNKANELLTKAGINNGKFLVRSSGNLSTPNSSSSSSSNATTYNDFYKISLCYNKEIKHYKIKYVESTTSYNQICGKFKLEFGLEFDSIIQLVDYYHRCADGLVDILRIPLLPIPNRLDPLWLNSLAFKNNTQLANQPYSQHQSVNIQQQKHVQNQNSDSKFKNQPPTESIYDSNRMYEAILNSNTNGTHQNNEVPLYQTEYLDDEPQNSNDITDLSKLPDSKRALFEDEDNYEYDSLSAYTVNLKDLVTYDKLGSGCFGSVHRGTYKYKDKKSKTEVEIPVAIKQLNIDTDESRQEIIKEADIMKSLKNPHIIKFIGMCFDQSNGRLMIVLELAKLGPLHKYLRAHKEDMSMLKIVKLCYQVALAMQYLASKNLVHRDLAARNVLLASEDIAKVSDFGMSRKMDDNLYYTTQTQGKWPLKWYPPEATSSGKFDEKSDVWSFGITCWEATSYGCRPYQGIDISLLIMKLENGYRLEKPQLCPQEIFNVMYVCWRSKHKRPTFNEIVKQLRTAIYEVYQISY